MKLKLTQCQELPETEVEIRYAEMDTGVQKLIKRIEQGDRF